MILCVVCVIYSVALVAADKIDAVTETEKIDAVTENIIEKNTEKAITGK